MSAPSPLLPRYRRPLTFGAILDETFQIYRRSWLAVVAIGALWAFAPLVQSLLGLAASIGFRAGAPVLNPAGPGAPDQGVVFGLLGFALSLLVQAAATAIADSVIRGERRSAWRVYAVALARLLPLVGAAIAGTVASLLLGALSISPFILGALGLLGGPIALAGGPWLLALGPIEVGAFGLLGGLIALVGISIWAATPSARRPWLKWLIILATPFGLPLYFGIRWSLCGQAVVLERAGPLAAMRRSSELVRGHWFRVLGIYLVVGLIATILQSSLPFVGGLIVGITDLPTAETNLGIGIAKTAANFTGAALFGTIPFIAATLLFVDLRNRHEGADLAERLQHVGADVPATA